LNLTPTQYLNYSIYPISLQVLTDKKLSELYIASTLTQTNCTLIQEEFWLQNQNEKEMGYADLIESYLKDYLIPISFLNDYLLENGITILKSLNKSSNSLEKSILIEMKARSSEKQKAFLMETFSKMQEVYLSEAKKEYRGARLYRAFDSIDRFFNFDYTQDRLLTEKNNSEERLYIGSGVAVQSGYSNIFLSLDKLNLKEGSKVVDLGSGYGRVGLIFALLRPDIHFTGYEYVSHRVEVGNRAASFFNLQDRLTFITQDLSLADFKLPIANVFYLYDPFTEETYVFILDQIVELSQSQQVTIVTKGNASKWLEQIAQEHHWPDSIVMDDGNIHIFQSIDLLTTN
jgi:hypothetical protein